MNKPWARMREHGPCMIFDWHESRDDAERAIDDSARKEGEQVRKFQTIAHFPRRGEITLEVCVCAAVIGNTGEVIRCHRHSDGLAALAHRGMRSAGENSQGFITSRGRFVDRREGRLLQEAAGVASVSKGGYRLDLLFSEDLY